MSLYLRTSLAMVLMASRLCATDLEDAIKQKLVTAAAKGADRSGDPMVLASFYGPSIDLSITNNGATTLTIECKPGQFLMPEDTTIQRMMCTQALAFTLKPHETLSKKIYAMCTQVSKHAPSDFIKFKILTKATGKLLQLAGYLSQNNYQSSSAQDAVWAVASNDANFLYSDRSAGWDGLYKFVTQTLGIVGTPRTYAAGASSPVQDWFHHVKGNIEYDVPGTKRVSIKLFDQKNKLFKTIVDNETQKAGKTYTYSFDFEMPIDPQHPEQKYVFVRYFFDDKQVLEKVIKLGKE